MKETVVTLCAGLIRRLRERGSHEETVLNYQMVCNEIVEFYEPCGDSNEYTQGFFESYLEYTEQRRQYGEISNGYARFKRRVVRLLEECAEIGYTIFSVCPRKKRYAPSDAHQELINQVLNEGNLPQSSRCVLDSPMRNFFVSSKMKMLMFQAWQTTRFSSL
jgi:hypothetical protein